MNFLGRFGCLLLLLVPLALVGWCFRIGSQEGARARIAAAARASEDRARALRVNAVIREYGAVANWDSAVAVNEMDAFRKTLSIDLSNVVQREDSSPIVYFGRVEDVLVGSSGRYRLLMRPLRVLGSVRLVADCQDSVIQPHLAAMRDEFRGFAVVAKISEIRQRAPADDPIAGINQGLFELQATCLAVEPLGSPMLHGAWLRWTASGFAAPVDR